MQLLITLGAQEPQVPEPENCSSVQTPLPNTETKKEYWDEDDPIISPDDDGYFK